VNQLEVVRRGVGTCQSS